jgi:hypothetical protein
MRSIVLSVVFFPLIALLMNGQTSCQDPYCGSSGKAASSANPPQQSASAIPLPSAPGAPLQPRSPEECSALQSRLAKYKDQIESEHAACIARGKPDRPWADGVRECNWSACETLHNYLHGGGDTGNQQQVASCQAAVQRYQARSLAQQQGIQTLGNAIGELLTPTPSTPIDSQNDLASYEDQQKGQAVLGDGSTTSSSLDDAAKNIMNSGAQDSGPSVQSQLDAATEDAITSDSSKSNDQAKQQAAEFAKSAAEYVKTSMEAWKSINDSPTLTGALGTSMDALQMANTASTGQVPTTIEPLEKLTNFLSNERNLLSSLAQKSANDWLAQSGVNAFDSSTTQPAQAYLDAWSQKLANMQQLLQSFTPVAQNAQTVLSNPAVNAVRMSMAQSTLPGLDSIALGDVISDLNYCSTQISTIQNQIKNARSVLH